MPVDKNNFIDVFSYHATTADQLKQYETLRSGARDFASTIIENTPICADQQAALRHLREAVMTANAAIALNGKI